MIEERQYKCNKYKYKCTGVLRFVIFIVKNCFFLFSFSKEKEN